jgi:uncharacterized membrane protein
MIFRATSHLFELGAFTCMALHSSKENRTMRFGILTAIFWLIPAIKFNVKEYIENGPLTYIALIFILITGLVVLTRVMENVSEESDPMLVTSVERYLGRIIEMKF